MDRQIRFFRLWQSTLPWASPRPSLFDRIADHAEFALLTPDRQQHHVHGITQFHQSKVRLQLKFRIVAEGLQIALTELGPSRLIERFYLGPLQPHHIQRDFFRAGNQLSMSAQPLLQPRTEIAQGERSRWT